jgi:hypothetical protein
MSRDILPCNIGTKSLKSIPVCVEDLAGFCLLTCVSVSLGSQEQAQLKRHIESWELTLRVWFSARDIVDAKPAFRDNLLDLLDADLAGIFDF